MTADYSWGPDECHHCPHRYVISAYTFHRPQPNLGGSYYLTDQYMTLNKYDGDDEQVDILTAERPEILARLKRVVEQRR